MRKNSALIIFFTILSLVASCGGGGGSGNDGGVTETAIDLWNHMGGAIMVNAGGSYGTKGTTATNNSPGAREFAVSWTDNSGNLWLFGGYGYDSSGTAGDLNDLWRYDGSDWTWVSGGSSVGQSGTYGTQGTADAANVPASRESAVSWIDSSGNLWLFGGFSSIPGGSSGHLNDLWKFDGSNWTWVSGSSLLNQAGTYSIQGTADAANVPGARENAISWTDSSGNLWLFGGRGYDSAGTSDHLNDLWKFDGSNWTWVSGSSLVNQAGTYGTQGTADAANVPGARHSANSWTDSSDNLWLFGGNGVDSNGTGGNLNDLWRFDGSNWTWVSGSSLVNQAGTYGTQGTAAASNFPGSRYQAVSWTDSSDNLWLFGGYGYDSNGAVGDLNDLWRFDGSNWTWVRGSDIRNQWGVYFLPHLPLENCTPGSRYRAVSWTDSSDNLWLFGGFGYDEQGTHGRLNDLWRYQP